MGLYKLTHSLRFQVVSWFQALLSNSTCQLAWFHRVISHQVIFWFPQSLLFQMQRVPLRRGDWAGVPEGPPWAIDAWGLGCLIQEVYRGVPLSRTDQLRVGLALFTHVILHSQNTVRLMTASVVHVKGLGFRDPKP